MKRRQFLLAAGASFASSSLALKPTTAASNSGASASGPQAASPQLLTAEPIDAQILPEGNPATPMLGYNGSSPGPVLRVKQGAMLKAKLVNAFDQGTAVHWHGLRSDNAMDGVAGLTQEAVAPGDSFDYALSAPDAGTYWYHAHNRSWEQVARGLYGPLIVEEASPPDVDRDVIVMVDDWRLMETGTLAPGFANMHDQAHQGRLGNFAKALIDDNSPVRKGDRLRLRLINVATDRVFPLALAGVAGKVVALDGMPLAEPQDLADLLLAPAQRVDVIADVTADPEQGQSVQIGAPMRDGVYELGTLAVEGLNSQRTASPIAALPLNAMPKPDDYAAVLDIELRLQGGAMSPGAATLTDIWGFNGQSGMSDAPYHRFKRGQWARIRMVNESVFAHGIHLHGHHFYELEATGKLGAFRDTTLVDPRQELRILCKFDNPGAWLLHCHMLGHQASGMKTWLEVV